MVLVLRRVARLAQAWRTPKPKDAYDVNVIGGSGSHGLATAYYLARNHDITNVAVLEKGWLGGGNTGRNETLPDCFVSAEFKSQRYLGEPS